MKDKGSFLKHYKILKVEGFEPQKLLSQCIKAGIVLRDIHIINDLELTMKIMEWDYQKFQSIIKNKYRITIIHENGYKPVIKKIISKRSTIVGIIFFILLMYYQSMFVSEIRVFGYKSFTEADIRNSLREAGFYEGCSKSTDINNVKLYLYQNLDNIAWIGIKYIGNMAEVTIVEGEFTPEPVDISKPCHIVAEKGGYIEKVIAKEGKVALKKGTFAMKGDILITGIVPVTSTAYGTSASAITERYVHSAGEVYAKVPYRFSFYLNKYNLIKESTGKNTYGIHLEIGDFKINTAEITNQYDSAVYHEKKLLKGIRPIPYYLGVCNAEEVALAKEIISQEELNKKVNVLVRNTIKEKLPENVQILNKSLKFSSEENIISVSVILETLEEIGIEKEIIFGEPAN